ncbi:MAG: hypothetical protein EX267_01720 [Acidimicrobiia bacterium]|nr:MAG: hypothetical protein EX267_01720 [Acidimicrobiia bacterium]
MDKRTPGFFADQDGILEIVVASGGSPSAEFRFIHADYRDELDLPAASFDLLVSLYAGFVSEHCTDYLKVGGTLLVNPSHGDVAMASIDPRYELSGVVTSRACRLPGTDREPQHVSRPQNPGRCHPGHAP